MGILIKDKIELSGIGNVDEIYGRLESLRINKIQGSIEAVILYYESKSISDNIGRKYTDDTSSAWAGGPINHTICSGSVFDVSGSLLSSGSEIVLQDFYVFPVSSSVIVTTPIYTITSQSVSFVDFDATGSQFVNYRIESQSVQTGTEDVQRWAIDLGKLNTDIYGYTYNLIKDDIKRNLLINSTIEDL